MCGMINIDLGFTYMADRVREDGTIIESAIDHIYVSGELEERIHTKKLEMSSTDTGRGEDKREKRGGTESIGCFQYSL